MQHFHLGFAPCIKKCDTFIAVLPQSGGASSVDGMSHHDVAARPADAQNR